MSSVGTWTSRAPSSPEVTTHILSAFLVCGLGILVCDSFSWLFSESLRGPSWSPCPEAALSTLLQAGRLGCTRATPGGHWAALAWARALAGAPVCSSVGRTPVSQLSGVWPHKTSHKFPSFSVLLRSLSITDSISAVMAVQGH